MIDFSLTDEQRALREMAHDFAEKEIRPVAWAYDREGTWPQPVIEKAWEVGLMNPHIPEEYGGAGASFIDGVLMEEELGWGCSGIGTSISCNGLASAPVLLGGSEQVKKTYLGMLTEAPKLASFCLTEPDAGSDVSGMRTRAVRRGDKYVINGSKTFITNGGYADWYTVYAKTDPGAGHHGISAFVVPRDAGVTVDKHEDKMGQRASNTATITFSDAEVPAANLLGEENHGFKLAMMTLDRRSASSSACRSRCTDPAARDRPRDAAAPPRRGAGRGRRMTVQTTGHPYGSRLAIEPGAGRSRRLERLTSVRRSLDRGVRAAPRPGRPHVVPSDDVGAHNKLRRLFGIDMPLNYESVQQLVARWHPCAGARRHTDCAR
jgi:Acyl-CoA dehydrogenase, middle domain/Acyl-CoA dehydrogenase, N-terminal domain